MAETTTPTTAAERVRAALIAQLDQQGVLVRGPAHAPAGAVYRARVEAATEAELARIAAAHVSAHLSTAATKLDGRALAEAGNFACTLGSVCRGATAAVLELDYSLAPSTSYQAGELMRLLIAALAARGLESSTPRRGGMQLATLDVAADGSGIEQAAASIKSIVGAAGYTFTGLQAESRPNARGFYEVGVMATKQPTPEPAHLLTAGVLGRLAAAGHVCAAGRGGRLVSVVNVQTTAALPVEAIAGSFMSALRREGVSGTAYVDISTGPSTEYCARLWVAEPAGATTTPQTPALAPAPLTSAAFMRNGIVAALAEAGFKRIDAQPIVIYRNCFEFREGGGARVHDALIGALRSSNATHYAAVDVADEGFVVRVTLSVPAAPLVAALAGAITGALADAYERVPDDHARSRHCSNLTLRIDASTNAALAAPACFSGAVTNAAVTLRRAMREINGRYYTLHVEASGGTGMLTVRFGARETIAPAYSAPAPVAPHKAAKRALHAALAAHGFNDVGATSRPGVVAAYAGDVVLRYRDDGSVGPMEMAAAVAAVSALLTRPGSCYTLRKGHASDSQCTLLVLKF